jgi:glycosyltransferase involved in cell wall biosynthesis
MCKSPRKLRVGFLSAKNYLDRHTFSGALFNMCRSLSRRADVVHLGQPYVPTRFRDLVHKLRSRARQPNAETGFSDVSLHAFGRLVEQQLQSNPIDIVFAPVASAELKVFRPKQPLVYASDATFQCLHRTYGFEMPADQAAEAEAAELSAIRNSDGITYSSQWAANSAVQDYGAPENKIRIIPYGANLDDVPSADAVFRKCDKRPWKFVFIGMFWHRKGGDITIKAFEALRKRGVNAELTIIGSEPPEAINGLPIQVIPFLDKHKGADRERLNKILLSSHVMFFPTRADCSPMVLCEAAAYGIPVVGADVGGISTIVTEQTGRLMPSSSTPEEYAAAVFDMIGDVDRYREFSRSARQRYEDLLNWDRWAESLLIFCEGLI